jgi:hypothetical protein
MAEHERDEVDVGTESAEPLAEREMMSLLSGSTTSVLPADGTGAADYATGTASDSPSTADDVPVPSSDASGSESQPVVTSDEDVSQSFESSNTASSET